MADGQALAKDQLGVDPPRAVGGVGRLVRVVNQVHQLRLPQIAGAGAAAAPLVQARPRHLQHPASRGDGDPVINELADHLVDRFGRTFSRAK